MSSSFPFALVDAFTQKSLGGNPCAIVFDADSLSDTQMLAIAKEMNQSETAFVLKPKMGGDLKARYFTPEREIPLAGHPTIATVHASIERGLISSSKPSIQLELNDGPITVGIEATAQGTLIRMVQRKPIFAETHDPEIVMPIFGLTLDDLLPGAPIQTVSTGTRQLMVPVKNHESLKKMVMKTYTYTEYRAKMNFFSPHLFCIQGLSSDATTFARHPGVAPDTTEDAFTGSATGGMAAFLWKHGLIQKPKFIAEQGHWMGRPGRAFVEIAGPRNEIESVSVAGYAVSVVEGKLRI